MKERNPSGGTAGGEIILRFSILFGLDLAGLAGHLSVGLGQGWLQ